MTRLIDADSVYKWYLEAFKGQIKPNEIRFSINDIRDNLENIPTIDAVPVIRCEDCKWGREISGNIECNADMNNPPEYHGYKWFCPLGEGKEE